MNANEIMNKIEELKNDEAIYANKNVLDDMAKSNSRNAM